jgi:hydroxyethylthiazole kinase-like uncharacterized protein yjeF
MKKLKKSLVKLIIRPREANSNKGSYGHALIIAGNKGRMGAAVIAARACLRAGCGLLTLDVPSDERNILQTAIPEAMLIMRENMENDLNSFSAVGVGPGIGTGKDSEQMLIRVLAKCTKPLVLDADALNIIALNKSLLTKIPKGTIITPHPKEFDRLFGNHKDTKERMDTAVKKAKEYNLIIVLKGHRTLITYKGATFLNYTGNAGLAKGGSGDALTGIITSFLTQGYEPFNAAKLGVYIHGLAADEALQNQSMESMLITDVIECLGKAFKHILNN